MTAAQLVSHKCLRLAHHLLLDSFKQQPSQLRKPKVGIDQVRLYHLLYPTWDKKEGFCPYNRCHEGSPHHALLDGCLR